jgi:hypothetical protein
MKFVNLTPHEINFQSPITRDFRSFPTSGQVARVNEAAFAAEGIDGIPCQTIIFLGFQDLPHPQDGTIFIVSRAVMDAWKRGAGSGAWDHRLDLVSPGTGPNDGALRDAKGQIVAVTRFNRM